MCVHELFVENENGVDPFIGSHSIAATLLFWWRQNSSSKTVAACGRDTLLDWSSNNMPTWCGVYVKMSLKVFGIVLAWLLYIYIYTYMYMYMHMYIWLVACVCRPVFVCVFCMYVCMYVSACKYEFARKYWC